MYVEGDMMDMMEDGSQAMGAGAYGSSFDPRQIEFNFLDHKHICCGLCGEIVPFDLLMTDHLPTHHPDVGPDWIVFGLIGYGGFSHSDDKCRVKAV